MSNLNELSFLFTIQNQQVPDLSEFFGDEKKLYEIDLNSRTIKSPDFLSIRKDHQATVIYFCLDRFYDYIDLSTTTGVIQYVLPGEETLRTYPIPFYDIYTLSDYNKMIIPWTISNVITDKDGDIQYAVRFYKITGDTLSDLKFSYNLNTLPATSKILYGLDADFSEIDEELSELANPKPVSKYEELLSKINDNKLYWTVYD